MKNSDIAQNSRTSTIFKSNENYFEYNVKSLYCIETNFEYKLGILKQSHIAERMYSFRESLSAKKIERGPFSLVRFCMLR